MSYPFFFSPSVQGELADGGNARAPDGDGGISH